MGQNDLVEKILEDYNDVFADIINVLIFNGEQRIKPSSLNDTSVHSMYKASDNKIHEQERDISKIWKEYNIEIALCGIENQTKIEKMMPLRIFGYEGASYRSQLLNDKRNPIPVVTIVLYYGKEHWNQPKTLKELVKIPDGLDEYINDCKIHVFEVSWLTAEQIALFKSDFKIVANFFVNRRKNEDYVPDDVTEIQHVDEVLKLLSVMTNDDRYESILSDEKGVRNMCEVAERLENRGRAEGRAEERAEAIEQLLTKGKSPEEIHELMNYPMEEIKQVVESLSATK